MQKSDKKSLFTEDSSVLDQVLQRSKLNETGSKHSVNIYLFKVERKNSKERSEICSKLTIKTPEQGQ